MNPPRQPHSVGAGPTSLQAFLRRPFSPFDLPGGTDELPVERCALLLRLTGPWGKTPATGTHCMNGPITTKSPSLMSLIVRGALWAPRRLAAAVKRIRSPLSADSSFHADPLSRLRSLKATLATSKTPESDINDFLNEHGPHFTLDDVNRFTNALQHPGGYAETVDNLIEAYERKQAPSTKV
jgi:hypothetical protein